MPTKQEEIREDVTRTFYEESDVSKTIAWLDLPQETKDSFFYKADNLLGRLQSQHGVVIKVDKELPENPYKSEKSDGFANMPHQIYNRGIHHLLGAGYVATIPIKEVKSAK